MIIKEIAYFVKNTSQALPRVHRGMKLTQKKINNLNGTMGTIALIIASLCASGLFIP